MRLLVVAEGKLRDRGLREVADDYLRRIRRHVRCDELELRSSEGFGRVFAAGAVIVALDVGGRSVSSRSFSELLVTWASRGRGTIVFLVGGAAGLPSGVLKRAHERLSLSSMTLPHRLARVLLLEQLYRAISIQRREPYARGD
ncbi:MAG: 23S rRNA (pseudouridine(1915)-N(3))-methyltransferase RlmH [Polyangiaceae bacterium]|nr:23S rRNA (pseudouridine(1915)-N(3))-methyltransferase RlmH [Polyangiaceae bacterium]